MEARYQQYQQFTCYCLEFPFSSSRMTKSFKSDHTEKVTIRRYCVKKLIYLTMSSEIDFKPLILKL